MNDSTCVFDSPTVAKLCSAWLVAPIDHIAATLAAIYTAVLLGEWLWKRVMRPFAENRGWVKRRQRRATDLRIEEE